MMFSRNRLIIPAVISAGLWSAAVLPAHASPLYDNSGSNSDGSDPIGSLGPLADSFTTGAGGFLLDDVRLLLSSDNPFSQAGITISLLADNGTSPGATVLTIGTLADSAVSSAGFAIYDVGLSSPFALAANTRYWLELTSSALPSALEWAWSYDQTAPGVAGEFIDNEFGVSSTASGGAYQLALVPEPATVALFAGSLFGLGLLRRRQPKP